ncbi:MAG: glycosyltransferase family 4 protein [Ruminococcaceae bacterium]|nr:glycosyltransferase family 4 protein [Oscillospiraceae bacterium]
MAEGEKAAYVATVMEHLRAFHVPYLNLLKENGYAVSLLAGTDVPLPFEGRKVFVPFQRSPFKLSNIKAYFALKKDFNEQKYDLIHCHTPTAGILTRLAACRTRKKNGTRVFYTAHGFHFFKGAPLINWLLFFPVEWFCSFFTDVLITINHEDYHLAKKYMHAKEIHYIPGIGVDLKKFTDVTIDRAAKRREIGVPETDIMVLSTGELNANKNHEVIIKALAQLKRNDISYVICGKGNKEAYLKELARSLQIDHKVHLLGHRSDIAEMNHCADIFAFPSKREGLGLAAIEAMCAGLPLLTSNIHGIIDYSQNNKSGFNCDSSDFTQFSQFLLQLADSKILRTQMGTYNKRKVKRFSLDTVLAAMKEIYKL